MRSNKSFRKISGKGTEVIDSRASAPLFILSKIELSFMKIPPQDSFGKKKEPKIMCKK
jgi:hypothetical protein